MLEESFIPPSFLSTILVPVLLNSSIVNVSPTFAEIGLPSSPKLTNE